MFVPEDENPFICALLALTAVALLAGLIAGSLLTLHVLNIIYLDHVRP